MAGPAVPAAAEIKSAVQELLPAVDFQTCSIQDFRRRLEEHLQLAAGSLDSCAHEVRAMLEESLEAAMAHKASSVQKSSECDLGVEDVTKSKRTYLVTLPHTNQETSADGHKLVPPKTFTPAQIGGLFLAALAATQDGRLQPLAFLLLSVFLERHRSGEVHYHIALLADRCFRFTPLKKQLLRANGLASHWSCSHEGYASCVAYCYLPSPKKPMEELGPRSLVVGSKQCCPPSTCRSKPGPGHQQGLGQTTGT